MSTERANLSNHAIKSKEHIAKMEIKLARLGDSQLLLDHVDKQQQTLDSLQEHLNKSEGSLILKDDIIKSLEKELDTLHRAFDVQDRYEKPIMNSGNVGTNGIYVEREKMRSLYYELGKRQSNAHSLTLSLADSSIEISQLKQALKDAALLKLKMEESAVISGLQSQQELEEKKNLLNELSNVQENSRRANELHSKMMGQSEDLTKRLSELRCASDVIIAEKETLVFELSSLLYASQLEVVSLNGRIEELKQSVTLLQSSSDLTEQRSMTNLNKAIIERQVLTELLQEAELMKPELNMVHQHLEDAIRDREEKSRLIESARRLSEREILQARDTAEDLQRQLVAAQEHLEVIQKRECDLEEERTSALTTLQRTLEAAKALTVKLQCEKDRRILAEERANKAERLAETLQRAKEHVSSAVLDALHQEKAKSVRLEKVISQMTNSRDYIPHPVQRSSSVSPHRSTVTGRSDGEYNYDGHFSASIGGMSILPAQAATTSSSLKRHPLSAMQSIPPHNFLGRTVSSDLTAGAVIMEHRRSLPSFSQSSPSRMTACNLQNGQSKDLRRESWRLMERAVDSGVDTKRSRETLEDEISRASHAYDSLPVPEVRASTSKLPTSVSPPKSIVDGLTR